MKDIIIIDHFSQSPYENTNDRFLYLANLFVVNGHKVEVIGSVFSHNKKKIRALSDQQLSSLPYKYTMLDEPSYIKNISIKRFYSHYVFGKNLKKYLKERTKPDVILCAVPSLDAGFAAAKYCKKNSIVFIADIQDIWPEAFKLIFNVPILKDIIFAPFSYKAKYIYKNAGKIVAVSKTYLEVGLNANVAKKDGYVIFLGTDLTAFDAAAASSDIQKTENEFWIAYAGTLGHSYNINIISEAIAILNEKGYNNIVFKVLGDGPLMQDFIALAKEKAIKADFLGRLPYKDMIGYLKAADIAVNPINKGAAQSIINKHADYAAAGLPVVNTQESLEYRELLKDYGFGINAENASECAAAIETLINNETLRKEMGAGSRKLAEDKFDRAKTYKQFLDILQVKKEGSAEDVYK